MAEENGTSKLARLFTHDDNEQGFRLLEGIVSDLDTPFGERLTVTSGKLILYREDLKFVGSSQFGEHDRGTRLLLITDDDAKFYVLGRLVL